MPRRSFHFGLFSALSGCHFLLLFVATVSFGVADAGHRPPRAFEQIATLLGAPLMYAPATWFNAIRGRVDDGTILFVLAGLNALIWGAVLTWVVVAISAALSKTRGNAL